MTEVIVDSVTTSDSVPFSAPHKISDKVGFDTAEVVMRARTDDGSKIRAIRIKAESTNRDNGKKVVHRGLVAGEYYKCGEGITSLDLDSNAEVTQELTYSEIEPHADGSVPIVVYAVSESEGWTT